MGPDAAEKFVRELLKAGDERRRDAEKIVAEIVAASRKTAEQFGDSVQREVAKQLTKAVKRIDQLEKQVETLTRSLEATRAVLVANAAKSVAETVAKHKPSAPAAAPAKKVAAKKASAKKTAVKKTAAKKPAVKKTAVKKTAATTPTTDTASA